MTTREAGDMGACLVMPSMKDKWIQYHRGCNSKDLLFKASDLNSGRTNQHSAI